MTEHRHPREIAAEIRENEATTLEDALVWGSYRSLQIFLRSIEWIDLPDEHLERYSIEHDGTGEGILAAIRQAMKRDTQPISRETIE